MDDKKQLNEAAEKQGGAADTQQAADTKSGDARQKQDAKKAKKKKKRAKGKGLLHSKKAIIALAVLVIFIIAGVRVFLSRSAAQEETVDQKNIGTVQRGEITSELTSSGTLAAKDSYTITSLVEGEIISADFEEGDQVEKDQVLYQIDPTDINQEVSTAQKNVQSAQTDLDDATKSYEDAVKEYNNGVYTAKYAGYIRDLTLEAGDKVGGANGTAIATLYDDTTMKLRLPFLELEADAIPVGADVVVTLNDTGEQIPGKVTEKSALEETLSGGTLVKYVTVIVSNPGGLTTSDTATVQLGDIISAEDGTFEPYTEKTLNCDLPDSVEVASVLVTEGQRVSVGTPLFTITQDSLQDTLRNYEKQVEQAENSLSSAEDQLVQLNENLDEYTITAPISGQVIAKNSKVGDKISRSSGSSDTSMAIIYDLSELTFEMSIDEVDISKVEVGQEVEITADAFDDAVFSGRVTNVSLNASNSNGVTTYPVTVTLDDAGDQLLPGMNVDGTIILEQAEDVLYIPSNALQRGNIVYVRDTSLTDAQKNGTNTETEQSGTTSGAAGNAESGALPGGASDMPEAPVASASNADGPGAGASADGAPAGGADITTGETAAGGASAGGSAAQQNIPGGTAARSDIPTGFTAVRVETGLVTDDYVEILSGLEEGQEVYVKDSEVSSSNMFGMGGFPGGGGMGGAPGGGGGMGGGGPR